MNIRLAIVLIGLWMLVGASSTFAVIQKIDEWVKDSAQGQQQVICFSDLDWDKGNQRVTDKQQSDIIDAALEKNASVIVQDYDVVDDGENVLQKSHDTFVHSEKARFRGYKKHLAEFVVDVTTLCGLTDACKKKRIPCCNIEFGQYLCNPYDAYPIQLSVTKESQFRRIARNARDTIIRERSCVTMADVANCLSEIYQEIAHYDDKKLQGYYSSIIHDRRSQFINEVLKEAITDNGPCSTNSFVDLIKITLERIIASTEDEKATTSGKRVAVKGADASQEAIKLTSHYHQIFSQWLCARTLHRIATTPSRTTFVCLRGQNIKDISKELPKLGYTRKRFKGHNGKCATEEDVKNVINQAIDIADYFNQMPAQQTPVLQQPKRFNYWRIVCATAVVATLSYLGYRYWRLWSSPVRCQ